MSDMQEHLDQDMRRWAIERAMQLLPAGVAVNAESRTNRVIAIAEQLEAHVLGGAAPVPPTCQPPHQLIDGQCV